MCYEMSDLARDSFTNGVWDRIWACYSSTSTYIAIRVALLKLLLFAVLCHLLLWWHKTTLGWFYNREKCGFNNVGSFSPQKGWLNLPRAVVVSPKKVVLSSVRKSRHKTIRGGSNGGFIPHLGVVLCPEPPLGASLPPHLGMCT